LQNCNIAILQYLNINNAVNCIDLHEAAFYCFSQWLSRCTMSAAAWPLRIAVAAALLAGLATGQGYKSIEMRLAEEAPPAIACTSNAECDAALVCQDTGDGYSLKGDQKCMGSCACVTGVREKGADRWVVVLMHVARRVPTHRVPAHAVLALYLHLPWCFNFPRFVRTRPPRSTHCKTGAMLLRLVHLQLHVPLWASRMSAALPFTTASRAECAQQIKFLVNVC
jgi:hypothetical protein